MAPLWAIIFLPCSFFLSIFLWRLTAAASGSTLPPILFLPSLHPPSAVPASLRSPSPYLPAFLSPSSFHRPSLHASLFPFLPSVDSIRGFAHAADFAAAGRCLRFLVSVRY